MKAWVMLSRLSSCSLALVCTGSAFAQKDSGAKPTPPAKTDKVRIESVTGQTEVKVGQTEVRVGQVDSKTGRSETFVFVRPPMPQMGREHTPMIFIRDERLGLTEAQQKKFDLVCREFVGKIHEIISNPAIPREQKGEKIKPLQASFKDKLKQILTPAQRADIEKREKQAMADGRLEFRDHPFGAMRVMMRRMPPPPGSRDFRRPPPPPPDDPRFE